MELRRLERDRADRNGISCNLDDEVAHILTCATVGIIQEPGFDNKVWPMHSVNWIIPERLVCYL